MSSALRKLSPRPAVIVPGGVQVGVIVDPVYNAQLGPPQSAPIVHRRMVAALPTQGGPKQLIAPLVVHDAALGYLADPDGNLIGVPGLWVHRLLSARWTEDTRRLGG